METKMSVEDKITKSINSMITDYPFFATLLLHMEVIEDDSYGPTACTDGNKIFYNHDFIDKLKLSEVCFILTHEVMHCALGHLWRRDERDVTLWNIATDLAINAIIKEVSEKYYNKNKNLYGNLASQVDMPKGCLYDKEFDNKSAEEIYSILHKKAKKKHHSCGGSGKSGKQKQNQNGNGNGEGDSNNNQQNSSSQNGSGNGNDKGNQQNNQSGGSDGWDEVTYNGKKFKAPTNHKSWEKEDKSSSTHKNEQKVKWDGRMLTATESCKQAGIGSAGLQRAVNNIKKPQKDWKELLHEFIQEEYNDYSLMPPDKRFDSDFFMFDFNDTIEVVKDVLFFVDTSGSMGTKAINMCYSEIQGALNQFKSHLHGKLLFFDGEVDEHVYDFDDVEGDISGLIPYGGGGTSFDCIFEYLKKYKENAENEVNGVVILTDGYCDYPNENASEGIPTLWIYTTNEEHKPPFGRQTILDESLFDETETA